MGLGQQAMKIISGQLKEESIYSGKRGYRDIANPSCNSSHYSLQQYAETGTQPAFGYPIL